MEATDPNTGNEKDWPLQVPARDSNSKTGIQPCPALEFAEQRWRHDSNTGTEETPGQTDQLVTLRLSFLPGLINWSRPVPFPGTTHAFQVRAPTSPATDWSRSQGCACEETRLRHGVSGTESFCPRRCAVLARVIISQVRSGWGFLAVAYNNKKKAIQNVNSSGHFFGNSGETT